VTGKPRLFSTGTRTEEYHDPRVVAYVVGTGAAGGCAADVL